MSKKKSKKQKDKSSVPKEKNKYKDMEKIWAVPYSLKLINGFLGLVITKYHLEMDRQAQDKLADPSCCEGVCKEEA